MKMVKLLLYAIIICLFLPLGFSTIDADEKKPTPKEKTFAQIQKIIYSHDRYKACQFILAKDDDVMAARIFHGLVMDFYWKNKSISDVVFFAQAGIQFCLDKTAEYQKKLDGRLEKDLTDEEKKAQDYEKRLIKYFSLIAKEISYNLASFCWDGWNEPGIKITKDILNIGLDASKLNLRIVKEIKDTDRAIGSAYWMLGAQLLSNKNYPESAKAFLDGKKIAVKIKDKLSEFAADAYIALVNLVTNPESGDFASKLQAELKKLLGLETEGAKFFYEQILVAKKVFVNTKISEKIIIKIWDAVISKYNKDIKLIDAMNFAARANNFKDWADFSCKSIIWDADKWITISSTATQKLLTKNE